MLQDLRSLSARVPPGQSRRLAPAQLSHAAVRTATLADLSFIEHLQRKFSNHVGFLPRAALVEYVDAGGVTLIEENGDPAGYVAFRRRLRSLKWCRPITQACVAMDAQRRHLGLRLLDHVHAVAYGDLLEATQCWIAEDLKEVQFFIAAGFQVIGRRKPHNARSRSLLLMRKNLNPFLPPRFFDMPAVAGCVPRRI